MRRHVSGALEKYGLAVDEPFPATPTEALRMEVSYGDGRWVRFSSVTPDAARELARIWYGRPEPRRRRGYRNRRRAARLGRAWSRTARTLKGAQVMTVGELNPDRLARIVRGIQDLPPGWWRVPGERKYDPAKDPAVASRDERSGELRQRSVREARERDVE